MRTVSVAIAALFLGLVSPAAAEDDLDYQGHTDQGKRALISSSKEGAVRSVSIVWSAKRCDRPKGFVRSGTTLSFQLDQPATKLDLAGKYTQGFNDGIVGIIRTRGKARLSHDRARWGGTFWVKVVLRADGRQIDVCKTPTLHWKAPLLERDYVATGQIDIQSDPGDSVGEGESETLPVSRGGGAVGLFDGGRTLSFGVESWSGRLAVDKGKIKPGTYTDGVDGAYLNVRGCCNSCGDDGVTGTFTITTLAHKGDLVTAADFNFEQYCFSTTDALRGTLHYRFEPPPLGTGPLSAQRKRTAGSLHLLERTRHREPGL